jgi:hypothetical protein
VACVIVTRVLGSELGLQEHDSLLEERTSCGIGPKHPPPVSAKPIQQIACAGFGAARQRGRMDKIERKCVEQARARPGTETIASIR